MLYVTTRNPLDANPAAHVLEQGDPEDGGFWVPFRHPDLYDSRNDAWKGKTSNGIMADMLNRLFSKKLSSWDLDFCIGRYPVRLQHLPNRVTMGEPWHNPEWTFENMADRLIQLMGGKQGASWSRIAVRVGVLFAIYEQMVNDGILKYGERMDVAVLSADFQEPMSAWYASRWGLPIDRIVCCCNENDSVWDLLCHGQFRAGDISVETCIPRADVVIPRELERMIRECLDLQELEDYLGCCHTGRTYFPSEDMLSLLRTDLYVSVVSSDRISQTIKGVWDSHKYLLSPESALVYSGLQDYRAKKAQIRPAVVMTENSPRKNAAFVAESLGISPDKLTGYF